MSSEWSLLMANQALARSGSFVFDPFVGTGARPAPTTRSPFPHGEARTNACASDRKHSGGLRSFWGDDHRWRHRSARAAGRHQAQPAGHRSQLTPLVFSHSLVGVMVSADMSYLWLFLAEGSTNIFTNFAQYKMDDRLVDLVACDGSRPCWRRNAQWYDAIVGDRTFSSPCTRREYRWPLQWRVSIINWLIFVACRTSSAIRSASWRA